MNELFDSEGKLKQIRYSSFYDIEDEYIRVTGRGPNACPHPIEIVEVCRDTVPIDRNNQNATLVETMEAIIRKIKNSANLTDTISISCESKYWQFAISHIETKEELKLRLQKVTEWQDNFQIFYDNYLNISIKLPLLYDALKELRTLIYTDLSDKDLLSKITPTFDIQEINKYISNLKNTNLNDIFDEKQIVETVNSNQNLNNLFDL